jgi:hypothetical protein
MPPGAAREPFSAQIRALRRYRERRAALVALSPRNFCINLRYFAENALFSVIFCLFPAEKQVN